MPDLPSPFDRWTRNEPLRDGPKCRKNHRKEVQVRPPPILEGRERVTTMTTSKYFKRPIDVAALILLAVITVTGSLIGHSLSANMYYNLNYLTLQMAADLAVRAGAEYLPTNPRTAVQIANAYAKLNGVTSHEIVLTGVGPDERTLRIRLNRQIPIYIALFAVGLPSRDIIVTASAQRRSDHPEGPLQQTSWQNGWVYFPRLCSGARSSFLFRLSRVTTTSRADSLDQF
jgi:hypothetical protein